VPSPSADLLKDSNSRNPGSTCVDLPPKGDILVNINHSTVLLRGVIRSRCTCVSLCGKVCCLPLLTKSSRWMTCFLNDCWNLFFNLPITLVPAGPEGRGDPSDPRVRLKRDCVALLAAFRLIDVPTRIFILGNTQLYWYVILPAKNSFFSLYVYFSLNDFCHKMVEIEMFTAYWSSVKMRICMCIALQ